MGEKSNREVVERYIRAIIERDLDVQDELRHRDFVSEYPQSGERLRGSANVRAMLEHYPGGIPELDQANVKIHGGEDHWVITPVGTIMKIAGSGDVYMGLATSYYPGDDRPWHIAVLAELRDGKILKETAVFGAPFDPPAWRAQWVERM